MAKNKYQLSQLHKVKIHHNRWFIWTIAYLCFIFIALLGYIQVSSVNVETEELSAENSFQPWRVYKNETLGFSLRYPTDWSIEAASETSLDFVPKTLSRPGVNISVYDSADEKKLRQVLEIQSEKEIEIDGNVGDEIISETEGKNTAEVVVLIENNGLLYAVRGTPGSVRAFVQTFNFLK